MDKDNRDFPQTELQENIRSFWSARGHSEIRAVLGNLSVTFHRPNPKYVDMGLDYQYLEQFWKQAQKELLKELIDDCIMITWDNTKMPMVNKNLLLRRLKELEAISND